MTPLNIVYRSLVDEKLASRTIRGKVQKTMILQRAGELFWEKGYTHTTLRDIARACGFDAANIYTHFKNKERLLYEVLKEEMEQTLSVARAADDAKGSDPSKRLESLVRNHIELVVGSMKTYRLLFDSELRSLTPAHRKRIIGLRDAYDGILRGIIRSGIERGNFKAMNEKVIGNIIASMIVRTRIWFSSTGALSSREIADSMCRLVLDGLRSKSKCPAPPRADTVNSS